MEVDEETMKVLRRAIGNPMSRSGAYEPNSWIQSL